MQIKKQQLEPEMEQLTGSKLGKEDDKAVYCHLLIYFIRRVRAKPLSRVLLFATPWTVATRLLCLWHSPGQNTGVGSCSLLQGIFPTQELNPDVLHCRQILYCMSHQGSPKYLLNDALRKIYVKDIYKNDLSKVLHLQRGK